MIFYYSLERGTRRRLPTVPNSQSHNSLNTQSLPRPPKVREGQSESRSRDRLEKIRSQSFEEEPGNRRQLPNVPKKPVRQNATAANNRDNGNREPTPDYDSTGGDKETKTSTPLATSPVKTTKPTSPEKSESEVLDNATNNAINNRNTENLNQTRGKLKNFECRVSLEMYLYF